jgi:membrane-bound ClpP family serine protease
LILGFIVSSPLLIWNDIKYLPTEHYCFISFSPLRGMLWMIGSVYGFPLLVLLIIYIRVTMFIHYQSNNQTLIIQRRQKRDLIVIQRIMITVGILAISGFPATVLLIMTMITGVEPPLTYRIQWLMVSVSTAVLSITTVVFTPQLKQIVMKKWRRNQVGNTTNNESGNTIPMRTIE